MREYSHPILDCLLNSLATCSGRGGGVSRFGPCYMIICHVVWLIGGGGGGGVSILFSLLEEDFFSFSQVEYPLFY